MADRAQAQRLVEQVVDTHGRLDPLINNAGLFRHIPVADATPEALTELFSVGVFGPSYLIGAAVKHLAVAGGSVVNVSSATAQRRRAASTARRRPPSITSPDPGHGAAGGQGRRDQRGRGGGPAAQAARHRRVGQPTAALDFRVLADIRG
ncbi:SDR family NAD(P)-dependent oxidoreductase [Kutzneria sp. NPDC052558]|uniref:SDR family NAD(P)-dependent oxidoreductase n=1 Tax=Kutzneria sp. NPDC052558 TaxID=3364121 RepID=UPI0037CC3C38